MRARIPPNSHTNLPRKARTRSTYILDDASLTEVLQSQLARFSDGIMPITIKQKVCTKKSTDIVLKSRMNFSNNFAKSRANLYEFFEISTAASYQQ